MPYSSSTGIFTPVTGATTATAGATIASATWNSINSDYSTAFTQLGPANLPFINGAKPFYYTTTPQTVNFGAAAGDIAVFAVSSILPPGITTYRVESLRIGNAQGNMSGGNATNISLYTAAGAGGTVVITSTATTIVSSLANNSNSAQVIIPGSSNTVMWNASSLFLHVSIQNAANTSANVIIGINPIY